METQMMVRLVRNFGRFATNNSSTILTGCAVAGVATTTILGISATPLAVRLIDEERLERADLDPTFIYGSTPLSTKDIIRLTWKLYVPTLAVGLITIGCIIGANHISLRRNAALASLYSLSEVAFKEYREKIVDTIGKNKELKIRDEISNDQLKKNPLGRNEVIITGKGEVMCYDSLSGRYFKSDVERIRRIVNDLNRDLLSDMFLTVNDLYYAIGLAGTKLGDMMGWDVDHMLEVEFSTQLAENEEPCLVLNYSIEPRFIN